MSSSAASAANVALSATFRVSNDFDLHDAVRQFALTFVTVSPNTTFVRIGACRGTGYVALRLAEACSVESMERVGGTCPVVCLGHVEELLAYWKCSGRAGMSPDRVTIM